ncbi:hypothetical protein BXQ17_01300 [Polaribacter sp. BM10]|uniref:outer membrane protein n=1 Tax=Polaribacter sp. BM10 TaxID=1529069 RepID=UPI00098AFDD8|nr:outer membrane beta-barrel protein [Polaribacter sp. BM10]AQS92779.1 hypothetical protein BXQ17_01300 [Polaribacter sp. BM10]
MKKIALLFITFITISINAQTEKGSFMIGASSNLNFGSAKIWSENDGYNSGDTKATNFSIAPKVGYFIIDNFVIGTELGLSYSKSSYENGSDSYKNNSFVFTPFLKNYFLKGEFKPFIEAKVSFGKNKSENNYYDAFDSYNYTDESNIFGYEFGAGIAYFINDTISVEFSLKYNKTKNDTTNGDYTYHVSSFNSSIGFGIFL